MVGMPDIALAGLPEKTGTGAKLEDVVDEAGVPDLHGLPRPQRRDANVVSTALEKAVRNSVAAAGQEARGACASRRSLAPHGTLFETRNQLVDFRSESR